MEKQILKYNEFLETIKSHEPSLIEGVQKAFNIIFEATEDVVERVKEKHPTSDATFDDESLEEPSDITIGEDYDEFNTEEPSSELDDIEM